MSCVGFSTKWLTWVPEKERKRALFDLIQSGKKTTTIRETRIRGFHPGRPLNLYYGLRTKGCTLIHEAVCLEAQVILIRPSKKIRLYQGEDDGEGRELTKKETQKLIRNDGFPNEETFFNYFPKTGFYTLHKWRLKTKPLVIEKDGLVTMMFD